MDHVDFRVVRDGLERDVRDALVDEALADAAVGGRFRWHPAGNLRFLDLSGAAVGEQIVRITGAHDAGAGQREGHARSVDADPATAPLLGDIGGGAGAAGWIKYEVARIAGHKNATGYNCSICFNYVNLRGAETGFL